MAPEKDYLRSRARTSAKISVLIVATVVAVVAVGAVHVFQLSLAVLGGPEVIRVRRGVPLEHVVAHAELAPEIDRAEQVVLARAALLGPDAGEQMATIALEARRHVVRSTRLRRHRSTYPRARARRLRWSRATDLRLQDAAATHAWCPRGATRRVAGRGPRGSTARPP